MTIITWHHNWMKLALLGHHLQIRSLESLMGPLLENGAVDQWQGWNSGSGLITSGAYGQRMRLAELGKTVWKVPEFPAPIGHGARL